MRHERHDQAGVKVQRLQHPAMLVALRVPGEQAGVDHARLFGDPERGSSLWCLAVDTQARHPGVGEMLVRRLAEQLAGPRAGEREWRQAAE